MFEETEDQLQKNKNQLTSDFLEAVLNARIK